jgi:hypothetical protein
LPALKRLKPSGEKSFEKLTATLLSQLIGMSIRLCKSGYQGGIDALAEIPIAIEDKRSQAGTLDLNELRGKLQKPPGFTLTCSSGYLRQLYHWTRSTSTLLNKQQSSLA